MKTLASTIAFTLHIFFVFASDNDSLPTEASVLFTKIEQNAITVDGYNDDKVWDEVPCIPLVHSFGDSASTEDFSACIQLAWYKRKVNYPSKDDGLYLYCKITDDSANYLEEHGSSYLRDCADLYFYWGNEGDWGPNTEITGIENDTIYHQIRVQLTELFSTHLETGYCDWRAAVYDPRMEKCQGLEFLAIEIGYGWAFEAYIPFEFFAKKEEITDNLKFGFDVIVSDADEGDADYKLSLLNDSPNDLAWNNKAYLNTAVLNMMPIAPGVQNTEKNEIVNPIVSNGIVYFSQAVHFVEVYSVQGIKVHSVAKRCDKINLSHLNPGIYILQTNQVRTNKIIIP